MDSSSGYISCIKIGRVRVLPPLVTEESRSELRYYRDLALSLENCRKVKRHSVDSGVMVNSSDGSVVKKSGTSNLNVNLKVNDNDQSPNTREIDHGTNESPDKCKNSSRLRKNSYTVETPSPAMMKYIQSLDNNQLTDKTGVSELFVSANERISSFQPNQEIPEVLILLEDFCDDMVADEQLTLEDLDTEGYAPTKHQVWNFCKQNHNSRSIKRLSCISNGPRATSLPSSCRASPICVMRACKSSDCLKNPDKQSSADTDESGDTTPLVGSNRYDGFSEDDVFDLSRVETNPEKEQSYQYINDSFSKDFCLLDLNNSGTNMSRESDVCRESVLSDCSSVSLSKFLSEKKSLDDKEAELAAFLLMKEQLELKHRCELTRLLHEQQKEHDRLKDEFERISSISKCTSSPKSSYAYRDVVLKKYSPSEASSTPRGYKSNEIINAYKCEGHGPGLKMKSENLHRKMLASDDRKMENLREKFAAIVRGYWTRRLFKTARVQLLVQTIKDCLSTAVLLQSENDLGLSELDLQNRLLQQLTVAFHELHDIFALPLSEQLTVIATDREKKRRLKRITTPLPLSEATRRTLQRRTSVNSAPPAQRKFTRKRCKSASSAGSEANSCRSTPGYQRPLATAIMSQKYSVSQCTRRPWR